MVLTISNFTDRKSTILVFKKMNVVVVAVVVVVTVVVVVVVVIKKMNIYVDLDFLTK